MEQPNPTSCLLDVDARRICIIKPSALGDVVQTLPLLPVLRKRFPRARISWVINASLAPLLEGHPDLDELIPFERRGSLRKWLRLLRRLRRSEFDLVFDLQGLFRSAVMTLATGAALRVGLETAREGSLWACHVLIAGTGLDVSPHTRYRRVAAAMGVSNLDPQAHVSIPAADREWAQSMLSPLGSPVLAIHPGAGWVTKRWPPERFAVVACKAIRRYSLAPVLLGSAQEAGLALQVEKSVRRMVPNAPLLNIAGKTSLKQLAAVLSQSNVLLTNDSGPMQLAAGLGTPVVGIFTCTSPLISGPPGEIHELVATGVKCAASYRKRCPYRGRRHLACLEELDVDRVWSAFSRLMQKADPQSDAA